MTRPFTLCPLAAVVCLAVLVPPASAQFGSRLPADAVRAAQSGTQCDLHGVILDEHGEPLAGAVVSALGSTSAFAVSDRHGRFTFRNLPFGPYLVRAHLQGYLPAPSRLVQVDQPTQNISTIALARQLDETEPTPVLAAGIGPATSTGSTGETSATPGDTDDHDHGELAWRLRHLKRSVLKTVTPGVLEAGAQDGERHVFTDVGRAMGQSARLATALFTELPLNGEVNLLTATSFDRPQDLFSLDAALPNGIAFVSLQAPTGAGEWRVRGAITQGDLSSWILAGSYERTSSRAHRYQAGLSYGMQRYLGGNATALAAVAEDGRKVGAMYAYDAWTLNRHVTLGYGANYSRYDYLSERDLFSPRAGITLTPTSNRSFKVRASVSRTAVAPGAEEFTPPATGVWLPPERTFSPLSARHGFTPEYVDHVEVSAERDWVGDVIIGVRAFRQDVDDQIVTMFGLMLPDAAPANVGHYYVASGGDFEARGWGIRLSRSVGEGVHASVGYTQVSTAWTGAARDGQMLAQVAAAALRHDGERLHDLTTSIESVVPATETRLFVVYKINSGFADASAPSRPGGRFDVQLNQALPFLNFTSAQWEMLVAVRSLFRDGLLEASVYDELLVVRPPKRVVGGVTVRF